MFETYLLNEDGKQAVNLVRSAFHDMIGKLNHLCPKGREYAIVQTKLEEACFFAVKAVSMDEKNQELQVK